MYSEEIRQRLGEFENRNLKAKLQSVEVTVNSKEENFLNFCPDFVHEFCLSTGFYNLSSIYLSSHSMEHTKTKFYSVRKIKRHILGDMRPGATACPAC